ncbi:hypothetical protein FBUS_03301 [Fasciolopsis buskii]|uniref:Uncharacterized protein n=1 Tax=Fasciolopsis buskii TaxID=27845 RepID=A0A8E0VKF9_9TREM|nr:hypothetical protein FBUS_03301 [Fasciolopsis buski]
MLLIQDDPVAQRHFHQIPPVFMSSVTEPGSCQLSEQRFSDSPLVLATLVSLVPWCSDHVSHTETVLSGNRHRLIPPGCLDLMMTLCKRDSNQRPFVLLVLVDVLTAIDESGLPINHVIVHQRLHHLPQLVVHWESA